MGDKTGISWTDATWTVVTGCEKVSPGCGLPRFDGDATGGCYAMALAARLKRMGQPKYQNDGKPPLSGPGFGVTTHPAMLTWPLRKKEAQRIFLTSMGDIFHDEVPDDFIAQCFAVMALAGRHTFQVLTKRHARMRSLLRRARFRESVALHATDLLSSRAWQRWQLDLGGERLAGDSGLGGGWTVTETAEGNLWSPPWPLPNVHLGVSAEDQHWADIRIPALLDTPAAMRWVSAEPLLGPVDFTWVAGMNAIDQDWCGGPGGGTGAPHPLLNWIVTGGESGPGHRVMGLDWLESIVGQCDEAGVAVWVKQDSGPKPDKQGRIPDALFIREFPAEPAAVIA